MIQEKKPTPKTVEELLISDPPVLVVKEEEKHSNYEVKEEDFPTLPVPLPNQKPVVDDKDFIKIKKTTKNDKLAKKSQENMEVVEKKVVNPPQNKKPEAQLIENKIEKKEETKVPEKPKPVEKKIEEMDFPSLEESKGIPKTIPQKSKPNAAQQPKKKQNLNGGWDFDEEPKKKVEKKPSKKDVLVINDEQFPSLI